MFNFDDDCLMMLYGRLIVDTRASRLMMHD